MVVVVVTVASFQVESHCISIVREFASEGLLTVLTPVIQSRRSSLWRAPCLAPLRIHPAGDVPALAPFSPLLYFSRPRRAAAASPALVSRHRSDVVGCAPPSERSARRSAQPIPSVLASDATPRCASMASADRQMIG